MRFCFALGILGGIGSRGLGVVDYGFGVFWKIVRDLGDVATDLGVQFWWLRVLGELAMGRRGLLDLGTIFFGVADLSRD